MIYDKLYPYQKDIVDNDRWAYGHALFMDMGTGKTITSLAFFEKSPATKILVICLVSKIDDWARDIKEELGLEPTLLTKGTKKNLTMLKNTDCLIVNFESVWRLGKDLLDVIDENWFIIIDESHKIKNPKSKVGKYIHKLKLETFYKCILTGTPQSKGYIDFYNQLYFVDILQMSLKEFEKRYCVFGLENYNGQYVKVLSGYKNTDELEHIIVNDCIFFNREESELTAEEIMTTIKKHKNYDKFKKTKVLRDIIADNLPAFRMGLRQLCSGFIKETQFDDHKLQWVSDFLDSVDERVVIFYNFNMEKDALIEVCNKKGIPYSEYSGAIKDLTNFNEQHNGVAICNYMSAATGLNDLVKSRLAIMYSPTEDYILFAQSKKRLDRIGQTKKPLIYYLEIEGTIEVAIYKALMRGYDFDNNLFDAYINS